LGADLKVPKLLNTRKGSSKTEGMPVEFCFWPPKFTGYNCYLSERNIGNLRELTGLFLENLIECVHESTESYAVQWRKFSVFSYSL
jgi:hypothetical protein